MSVEIETIKNHESRQLWFPEGQISTIKSTLCQQPRLYNNRYVKKFKWE